MDFRRLRSSLVSSKLLLFFLIVFNNALLLGVIILDGMTQNGKHPVSMVYLSPWNSKFAKLSAQPICTVNGWIPISFAVALN